MNCIKPVRAQRVATGCVAGWPHRSFAFPGAPDVLLVFDPGHCAGLARIIGGSLVVCDRPSNHGANIKGGILIIYNFRRLSRINSFFIPPNSYAGTYSATRASGGNVPDLCFQNFDKPERVALPLWRLTITTCKVNVDL